MPTFDRQTSHYFYIKLGINGINMDERVIFQILMFFCSTFFPWSDGLRCCVTCATLTLSRNILPCRGPTCLWATKVIGLMEMELPRKKYKTWMYTPIKMEYSQKQTDIALEASIFPGKYHQNAGISMAMLVFPEGIWLWASWWGKVEAPSRRMFFPKKIGQEEIRRQFDLQQIFLGLKHVKTIPSKFAMLSPWKCSPLNPHGNVESLSPTYDWHTLGLGWLVLVGDLWSAFYHENHQK